MINEDGFKVHVSYRGEQSSFDASWLWHNDPSYVHPSSGQRLRSSPWTGLGRAIESACIVTEKRAQSEASEGIVIPSAAPLGSLHPIGNLYQGPIVQMDASSRLLLRILWKKTPFDDPSTLAPISFFDMNWLWRCRYDATASERCLQETQIRKEHALSRTSTLRNVLFDGLLLTNQPAETDNARYDILDAVVHDGAVLVAQTPDTLDQYETTVGYVGHSLSGGGLSHGQLYGDIFHVETTHNAHNLAYTSVALPPHQDLAYYDSKPGLQLLHCVANSADVLGGESVLVDAVAAAQELRNLAPDHFEALTKCPATFLKQREGADMVYRRTHVEQDSTGSVVAVHWSPPFQGPLCIRPDLVDNYFVAYAVLERMLDNSLPRDRFILPIAPELEQSLIDYAHEYTWQHRLEEGHLLIFNNQRMLHGRRGFQLLSATAARRLVGCYTDMDDTMNQYRLLRRQRMLVGEDERIPFVRNLGNGSSGSI